MPKKYIVKKAIRGLGKKGETLLPGTPNKPTFVELAADDQETERLLAVGAIEAESDQEEAPADEDKTKKPAGAKGKKTKPASDGNA